MVLMWFVSLCGIRIN